MKFKAELVTVKCIEDCWNVWLLLLGFFVLDPKIINFLSLFFSCLIGDNETFCFQTFCTHLLQFSLLCINRMLQLFMLEFCMVKDTACTFPTIFCPFIFPYGGLCCAKFKNYLLFNAIILVMSGSKAQQFSCSWKILGKYSCLPGLITGALKLLNCDILTLKS